MVRRAVAALVTALLVAACGSGSRSTSTSSSAASTAGSSTPSSAGGSTAPAQTTSSSTSTTPSSSSTTATTTKATGAAHHTHTQPPESTPHFVVKLKIGSGGALTPPGVAIGGHTMVQLSVSNGSGGSVKLELAHGSKAVFTRTLPPGRTTAKLPTLANAAYTVLIDGAPRGTLTIGAKAGP